MADGISSWLFCDRLPRDLFELAGRMRLDPDIEGLRQDLQAARCVYAEYQSHPHPPVGRQATRLLREVGKVLDYRGRLRSPDDLLAATIDQLRAEYSQRQGVDRLGWDRSRLRRWLEREANVHPDSVDCAADALLEETVPTLPSSSVGHGGAAPLVDWYGVGARLLEGLGISFYWSRRFELLLALRHHFDDSDDYARRTLWFYRGGDDPRAWYLDGKWTIQVLGGCAACGTRAESPFRAEQFRVVDLARPLWMPVVGLVAGVILALFFWNKWLLPLAWLGGFFVGAHFAKTAWVRIEYQTCPVHEGKFRPGRPRLYADRLAVDGMRYPTVRYRDAHKIGAGRSA